MTLTAKAATKAPRTRLSPEIRRKGILDAAAVIVLDQGYLPLPLDRLAREASVSKALIYVYFPTQHDLFNALLAVEFEALFNAGLAEAVEQAPLEVAARACACIYFHHVARHGPLSHVILRDHYMQRKLSPDLARRRDRLVRAIARASRRELHLHAKENIAAINLVITIPEETGRLAYAGMIAADRAAGVCETLVTSALAALAPTLAQD